MLEVRATLLRDKVLIVTGASKGIGLSIAAKFSTEGWSVVNLSRSPCPYPGVINLTFDLSDLSSGGQ